jgi:hypothetical protein
MNDSPQKFHTGYLVEGLELLIRKVAYTKYDATWLVPWSNYTCVQFGDLRDNFGAYSGERELQ